MSTTASMQPDKVALLAALREAIELCRRLKLRTEAVMFEDIIKRFERDAPTFQSVRDIVHPAINGIPALRIITKLGNNLSEFNKLQTSFGRVMFPDHYAPVQETKSDKWKAVRKSDVFWQLDGESDLHAITIPKTPKSNAAMVVRLTLSNSYGPLNGVRLLIQLTGHGAKNGAAGKWIKADPIEEIVHYGGRDILRSDADEPFKNETPWWGTYEAKVKPTAGKRCLAIKIESNAPKALKPRVLIDWVINARKA